MKQVNMQSKHEEEVSSKGQSTHIYVWNKRMKNESKEEVITTNSLKEVRINVK